MKDMRAVQEGARIYYLNTGWVKITIMHQNKKISPVAYHLFLVLLFTACSSVSPAPLVANTPTLLAVTQTPVPIPTTPIPASPTIVLAPTRASYTLDTTIDYDAHRVSVNERIVYPNHTGQPLNALVLAVVPNLWQGCFLIASLAIDDVPVSTFAINGQRLEISLPELFHPETTTTIAIQYTLDLPRIEQTDPNISRPRIFGYSQMQVNLTNWYPFVVPFSNGDWVLHDPWYYGEHLVYDAADYMVDLRFTDPVTAPVVAASGAPEARADFIRYTLNAGRAFAISASREFQVSTGQINEVTASSYTFPFYQGQGQAALRASTEALQLYSRLFGPYPHKNLSVVMGDFNDGMEFSAFFFLPRDFYNLYNDSTPHNYLISVAAHETAHQWWFEQVANDQALQPWLDEALSTYSERLYYETYQPQRLSAWWSYRIDFFNPQGFMDAPIYDFQGFRPYTDTVYFRGAHFLEDLRTRIGDEPFFTFLQSYLAQENGKIATAGDFFRILREHTSMDFSDIVRQYFQNIY